MLCSGHDNSCGYLHKICSRSSQSQVSVWTGVGGVGEVGVGGWGVVLKAPPLVEELLVVPGRKRVTFL